MAQAAALLDRNPDPGPPPPVAANGPHPSASTRSTLFEFEHKLFHLPDARMVFDESANQVMFHARLGDLSAVVPLAALCREFGVASDGPDGKLLTLVARSLRFVKIIRHGDSIPRELLDGSASWRVEERHLLAARGKLCGQIAIWMKGRPGSEGCADIMAGAAEAPLAATSETERFFNELAAQLGPNPCAAQAVADQVERCARELAYIEALREHADQLKGVIAKLGELRRTYDRDRGISEEVARICNLMKQPFAEFGSLFEEIDGQTCEMLAMLRNLESHIELIRDARDSIHQSLMPWKELFAAWRDLPTTARSRDVEARIRRLYQFLAARYAPKKEWK